MHARCAGAGSAFDLIIGKSMNVHPIYIHHLFRVHIKMERSYGHQKEQMRKQHKIINLIEHFYV